MTPPLEQRDQPETRRDILKRLAALGIGTTVFQRAIAAQAEIAGRVTPEMVQQAEWISGLKLDEEDCVSTAESLNRLLFKLEVLRSTPIDYKVVPALSFHPAGAAQSDRDPPKRDLQPIKADRVDKPADREDVAFLPVTELASLVRTKQISSVELTRLYLDRLQTYNDALKCVVTFCDDLAMRQAKQADREIANGHYRGVLHGIPWGAKDLIAYPGYKTTWGAPVFQDQQLETKATVASRLDDVGAVLIAKLSLGALAMGDKWFGGMTRNPWNIQEGSSGSSAGSAAAVAAGLVGFAIGSETLGSILSPSRRCGVTGLRPTFGRVSRHGCMSLAWSMDKIGPIARSVEDCALVLAAIHGRDGHDVTVHDMPLQWPPMIAARELRIGFTVRDGKPDNQAELNVLEELGAELVPIELPDHPPAWAMNIILNTEAATVFDELTRAGITDGLNSWPGIFRQSEFIPAVEYLRANRLRTVLIDEMQKALSAVDAYIGGDDLTITNLTGHPSIAIPNGFAVRRDHETPTAITFTGQLFGETKLLAIAREFQRATGYHLRRPPLKKWLEQDK